MKPKINKPIPETGGYLQEIHHRIKNNFHFLISLMQIQSSSSDSEEAKQALNRTMAQTWTIAEVYRLAHHQKDDSSISAKDLTASIIRHLTAKYNKDRFELKTQFMDVRLPLEQAIPFAVLVYELTTNALKHTIAATAKARIAIQIKKDGHSLVLIVKDNGPGLPKGFDFKNNAAMGIKLINILTSQINGKITIDDSGQGLTLCVVISLPE